MKKPLIISFLFLTLWLSAFSQDTTRVYTGDDGSAIGDSLRGDSSNLSNRLILVKKPYSMSPAINSVRIIWQTPDTTLNSSIV